MKVSIIIPLYNKAPYVEKCLSTVCSQTYTDWEAIIVDDGSTDNSGVIAEEVVKRNEKRETRNFRIIHQENAGVAAARNSGIAEAKGEYVAFLDADDWWEPTYLEEMMRFVEEYPEAGLYASNYIYYKPGKTRIGVTNLAYTDKPFINYPKSYYQGTGMPIWTGAIIVRRGLLEEMGGFPVGIKLGEDFLLWSKIALNYKIAFLNNPLACYNNDVPATMRATRNLHEPEHHMLFHLENIPEEGDWKILKDKLRADGLMKYWLDERYHDFAKEELMKVDWNRKELKGIKREYEKPIWWLKAKREFMHVGSVVKQTIRKFKI